MKPARSIVIALVAGCSVAAHTQAQTVCRIATWFNPTGAANAPFSNVAGAACATPANGVLTVAGGTYYEYATTLHTPVRITTTTTPVVVGRQGASRTHVRLVSLSTHLYGETSTSFSYALDNQRTEALKTFLATKAAEGANLIALQDVFDLDFALTLHQNRPLAYGNFGTGIRPGAVLSSGLGFMSAGAVSNAVQALYSGARGEDLNVSRSFFRVTITQDGQGIGFYNTSLQQGSAGADATIRSAQIQLLASDILAYRQANPSHVVIIAGNFNLSDTTTEYTTTLSNQFGGVSGAADTAPNLACVGAGVAACTGCSDNALRTFFGGTGNVRSDYVAYADSWDGQVRIIPKSYDVSRATAAAPMTGNAFNAGTQTTSSLTTDLLADHSVITADFDIVRR